ncbi:MAG: hypothetical protein U9P80_04110 [Thermodesulfobacteriota bacterium]|nr:hypothetical protein [Thermodesulfobacteriota bacterium]
MFKNISYTLAWFVLFVILAQICCPLKRSDYYNLNNSKALWVKQRIFSDHEAYDTIFLGTSHTLSAIDPAVIRPDTSEGRSLNLSICWGGRNLYYIFARDLLENHKVKNLVVEICSDKPKHVFHPAFRFYCNTRDVFDGPPASVKAFALFHKKMFTTRLSDICAALLKPPVIYMSSKLDIIRPYRGKENLGFLGFSPVTLPDDRAKRLEALFKQDPARVVRAEDEAYFLYPPFQDCFYYISKISTLAREHNTHLYIMYLPSRNDPIPPPAFTDELSRLGTFVCPDLKKIYRYDLWYDDGHLNSKGAAVLSKDLIDRIK